MKILKMSFVAAAAMMVGYLSLTPANAYDPCERCYKQYDSCIASGTAASTCRARLQTCTSKYCT